MHEIEKIEELYDLYGMTTLRKTDEYIVFVQESGYFKNAEVLYFEDTNESVAQEQVENCAKIGLSARMTKFAGIQYIQNALFQGFFDIKQSKTKMRKEYDGFATNQCKRNALKSYEYIQPVFAVNNMIMEQQIVEEIFSKLFENGAQLIIVEAAAGFGKTCVSYEILKKLSESDQMVVPIFIELSKNRTAPIFRYVLLDEIDMKFSNLKSSVVVQEIKEGRIPLIIDGFDELLGRSHSTKQTVGEKAETMLETIAELFGENSKAKIILTSRKSALFIGKQFDEWADQKLKNTCITRVRVEEPTLLNWLGAEKNNILEQYDVPPESVKNPILLSYLRQCTVDEVREYGKNIDSLTEKYFLLLLEREKERQSLLLNPTEQLLIMTKLASNFIEFDILSEDVAFVRDLLKDIIQSNFDEYQKRYASMDRIKPTKDEFAVKLSAHALLDRISMTNTEIGFINDFIYGYLIAEAISEDNKLVNYLSERLTSIMCTTISICLDDKRCNIFNLISKQIESFSVDKQLFIDFSLMKTISRNYKDCFFSNCYINEEIFFDGNYAFTNCTFQSCTFNKCKIKTDAFNMCAFQDCNFYGVDVYASADIIGECTFFRCSGHEKFEKYFQKEDAEETYTVDYCQYILGKFWSKRYSKGRVHVNDLKSGIAHVEIPAFDDALVQLKKKNLLYKEGALWCINKDKMKEIKTLLGK